MTRTCLLILGGLMLTTAHAQTMYKWTDANGSVQYGPKPPAGVQATPVRVDPGPRPAAEESAAAEPAAEATDPNKPATIKEWREQRAKVCQQIRSNIATLQASEEVELVTPDGQMKMLRGADKEAELTRLKGQEADFCSGA